MTSCRKLLERELREYDETPEDLVSVSVSDELLDQEFHDGVTESLEDLFQRGVITKNSEGVFCNHDGTRLPLDPPRSFFAWTKSRVYFLEETEYGRWFVNSVPRNPVSLLG